MTADGIQCGDMLCLLFDLNELDLHIYRQLLKGEQRAEDLAAVVDKDRSTVHRSLTRLVDGGLCTRERRLVNSGGRYYIYRATPPAEVKQHIHACIERWHHRMHASLDRFVEEFITHDDAEKFRHP